MGGLGARGKGEGGRVGERTGEMVRGLRDGGGGKGSSCGSKGVGLV